MKQYEKYKPSGIEWLGEIPEHWEVKRVKDLFNSLDYKRIPISGEFRNAIKGGEFDYYGASGVIDKIDKYIFNDELILIGEDGANLLTRTKPLAFIAKGKFWVNNHAHILKPKYEGNINYLSNFLESLDYTMWVTGSAQPKLTQENLNNIFLFNPPATEQTTIANYLDNKTAAIDRKIELLTAKADKYKALRRSLTNETVCRGLNPDVPMKDSGIEWIGMIPEHWEVKRVKDVFYIGRGRVIGQEELVDNGIYPVYSSQTENNGCLGYIDTFDFSATLLTWTTDGANAGTLFKREGKFNCTNVCGTLKPKKKKENLDFILYVLQIAAKHNKRIDTNGAKIMNNEMSVIPLLYPPEKEQESIAQYLNVKTAQIDTILSNINNQISKLTQLRKTLINDVVTGKIKVTESELI